MQTSLARRQRHRRMGAGRRPRGSGASRRIAVAIPLVLFGLLLAVALVAFVATVSGYAFYSRDLPDPKSLLANLQFAQQTVVYDRTGKVELARLGSQKREIVTFDQIAPALLDATTSVEDKDFWSNPGFDIGGVISAGLDTLTGSPRGGSTITQQLVRARLLPQSAFAGSVYERKIREIIQSIRLTQEFPGQQGKQEIITAYLNQNFYGNNSYGIQAAALGYFGKPVKELDLAQVAILAAIPQSPSAYDLVQNAVTVCSVKVAAGAECPAGKSLLEVPASTEIVQRRNRVLDLMRSRSVLTAGQYTVADYEAAKREPVILAPQGVKPWKAAQFVWQVRQQLAAILCGTSQVATCDKVDAGGYRVTTTLDWSMQQIAEKWTYVAARAPQAKDPTAILTSQKIPKSAWGWIQNLRGRNINNAASGVLDYRTGQILAYVGSASYTAAGTKTFQPQFDVLSDGWRQSGSAIKPLNYITGIDDHTMTASTMFMDVVTDFGNKFLPTQADKLERGPVRLREALEFSLNVPAIKAGLINGLDHVFQRTKDFGIRYLPNTTPVVSMSIGTLVIHPIDLLDAYGAIADGGVLMPRTMILSVTGPNGEAIYPTTTAVATGTRVASAQASYIITDILAGNTITTVNPYWGAWAIMNGNTRRPAAYKTGTTSDNRDVLAYGFLAPPADPAAPALAAGIWMGNSDNSPNNGSLSLDSSAPLWSAILSEISHGQPITDFQKPAGIVTATVDAYSGMLPGPFTTKTIQEVYIQGTVPTQVDTNHVIVDIDSATGLLWQNGCSGPKVAEGFLDFSRAEASFPAWQKYTLGWEARAARGVGVRGGPMNTRTTYFYSNAFAPFGRTWGGRFAPTATCSPLPPPPVPCGQPPVVPPGLPAPTPVPCPTPAPSASSVPIVNPTPTPNPGGH